MADFHLAYMLLESPSGWENGLAQGHHHTAHQL
jgi:hypothetical protein